MPDEDTGGEAVPVVPAPAVLVHERSEEERRVGDAPGDHDVGPLREGVDDRTRTEVRRCEQRRPGERVERGAGVDVCERLARVRVQRRKAREHVVADHGRDLDAGDTELARGVDRGVRGGGRVDAAGVRDHLGATVGDERQRPGQVRGKIARVPARFVALAILLQDRKGQLGQRLEAEIVDALREQCVDRGGCVAVETLSARDNYLRHGDLIIDELGHRRQACTIGTRSIHGFACSSCAATRRRRSSRP